MEIIYRVNSVKDKKETLIFYESPHRILKTLESLKTHIGDRKVVIAREISKIYEQIISGTSEELLKYFDEIVYLLNHLHQ